ncbi:hypothetical protein ACIQU4_05355 [Streptomyces sp. NPDC090741]|uniref:hypothetical protein n=1 Tax=Streptomyces sp. NPDC090741 TaxID=3365967 RepID=UPI00382C47CB
MPYSLDHKVVDGFIRTMERNSAGLATQSNAFDKVIGGARSRLSTPLFVHALASAPIPIY